MTGQEWKGKCNMKMKKVIWIILMGMILMGCSASSNQIKSQPADKPEEKQLTKESTIEELIKQLGNEDWQTREKASQNLIAMGNVAVPRLKEALNDKDPEVRKRALWVLNEFDVIIRAQKANITPALQKRIDELMKKLGAETSYGWNEIMEELEKIGKPAFYELIKATEHENKEVRCQAIVVLDSVTGGRGYQLKPNVNLSRENECALMECLIKRLKDTESKVRFFALNGLRRFYNPTLIPNLEKFYTKLRYQEAECSQMAVPYDWAIDAFSEGEKIEMVHEWEIWWLKEQEKKRK
jgi:HEAT repeat protein